MATGIWVRLMHKNHILRDATVDCTHGEWKSALDAACRQLDMPRPLILARRMWFLCIRRTQMPVAMGIISLSVYYGIERPRFQGKKRERCPFTNANICAIMGRTRLK